MIKEKGMDLDVLSRTSRGSTHFPLVFLLFFLQGQFYEHLLQLLIAVVDHELLKAVILHRRRVAHLRSSSLTHHEPVPLNGDAGH